MYDWFAVTYLFAITYRFTQRDAIGCFIKKMSDLVFIKFNSKLKKKRGMRNRDPIVDHTFVDVVEDEYNEWIIGVVHAEGVQIVHEPDEAVQGVVGALKRKRAPQ